MILISHRGNISGSSVAMENTLDYINNSIVKYDCEIDIHYINDCLFLGHNTPEHKVDINWLEDRKSKLWIHCKNLKALSFFNYTDFNYFWHENDKVTLTSKGYIWAFPGNQPIKNSIAVMPELYGDITKFCLGICSDYIENYKV